MGIQGREKGSSYLTKKAENLIKKVIGLRNMDTRSTLHLQRMPENEAGSGTQLYTKPCDYTLRFFVH